MDIIQFIKSKLGRDIFSFYWSLAFVLANLALFAFFSKTTSLNSIGFPIITFIAFLILGEIPRWKSCISLIVVVTVGMFSPIYGLFSIIMLLVIYAFFTKKYYNKTKESFGISIDDVRKDVTIFMAAIMTLVATLRSLFFNISYMLFPLLFMWLTALGGAWWLGYVKLSLSPTDFAAALTVLGVIFGLLQYYFSRHEEKVQNKLNSYFTSVIFPIEEFSFAKFCEFLSDEHNYVNVKKEVDELTQTSISEISKYFRETQKERSIVTLNLPDFGDRQKFQVLEAKSKLKKELNKAYKNFFVSKTAEIKKYLAEKRASLNETVWFMLSNINIIEEANIFFLMFNLNKENGEPESYADFLLQAKRDILKYILDIVIEKKLSDKGG